MSDDPKDDPKSLVSLRPALDGKEPGLPSRYTVALHVAIVHSIQAGNTAVNAAVVSGLPRKEFYAWKSAVADGTAHPAIVQLFEDMDRGGALAEAAAVATIQESPTDKADHAWKWLERARSSDWSKNETVTIRNELVSALDRLEAAFSEEPQLYQRILGVLSAGNGDK